MTHSLPDEPPMINAIAPYDEAHFGVYLRLLDAKAAGFIRASRRDMS